MTHVNQAPFPAGHTPGAPLLPFPPGCVVGRFVRRHKRFSVAIRLRGEEVWIHSNNSGSMMGLLRPGMPVLASPASNPARKLKYTQECVWCGPRPPLYMEDESPARFDALPGAPADELVADLRGGFWTGVNTAVPNRLLEAAFAAGRLPFATGYSRLQREARRGDSRLDACLTGQGLPPLWVECKNVTMTEDDVARFPDAATERGQKHLRAMMDIVRTGGRAVTFYLVQRADGRCFGPADFIDAAYAELFYQAMAAGVEMRPFRAHVTSAGIDLGEALPVLPLR